MRGFANFSLCLVLLCGCSTLAARKQEKSAAWAALSEADRDLLRHGRIDREMDTNAVYIAWGKPSAVSTQPSATGSGTDQVWYYYGDRPVLVPGWVYVPNSYGYWTLEYSPSHYSERYLKAEVIFHDGRVVEWNRN